MTTQTPYQPTPPPPPDAYPTAPPWAPAAAPAEPEQAGVGQPGWAGVPYTPHGQLMVKYPNALQDASRPQAPALWPVAIITLALGVLLAVPAIFGVISAARRAARAGKGRHSRAPYWVVFVASLAAVAVAWAAVIVVIALPIYRTVREAMATELVQDHLVHDGKIKTVKGTAVAAAKCEPTAVRSAAGLRPYACVVTLSNGRSVTKKVVADRDGTWTAPK